MKCQKCGNEFEGKFCPECGLAVVINDDTATAKENNNSNSFYESNQQPQFSQASNQANQQIPTPNQQNFSQKTKIKKPIYKKWWFWVIIVIVIVIILVIANLGGKNNTPKKITGANTTITTTTTTPKDENFSLNDTAKFDSISITANEIKESSGTMYFKPESGKTFIGVKFTIENTSDVDQTISSMLLFDAYVDGVKCDYSFNATCAFDGQLDGTISAGKKMVGYYCVEVPQDWSNLELQVKSSWLSDTKAAFVFNK